MCSKKVFVIVRSLMQFFLLIALLIFIDLLFQPKVVQESDTDALMGGVLLFVISLVPYLYQRSLCQIKELNPIGYMTKRECRLGIFSTILQLGGAFFLVFAIIALIEYFVTFEYETFSAFLGLVIISSMFALPYYNHCRIKEIKTDDNKQPMKFFGKSFKARPKCPNCGSSTIEKKGDHYVCAYCDSVLDLIDI